MQAIIGTTGYADHGKTLPVKALTGIDTDRLIEEKAWYHHGTGLCPLGLARRLHFSPAYGTIAASLGVYGCWLCPAVFKTVVGG